MADEHLTPQPFALAGFNSHTRSSRPRLTLTRLILLGFLLLLFIGGLGYWQVWRLAQQSRTAVLTELSGPVEVWRGTNGAWQAATPGLVLQVGDKVRTGAAAAARITYFDGSLTRMSASTTLELTELSARRNGRWQGIAINQEMGQTEQLVLPLPSADSRFEITTAAARIAVQGAAYQVIVDEDGITHITVIEGQVVVYDGQNTTQTIAAGDSLILTPVAAITPADYPTTTLPTDELTPEFTPTATASPTTTTTPSATTVLSVTTTLVATFTPTPIVTATVSPTPGGGGLPTLTPRPTFPPTLQPTPTHLPPPTAIPPGDNDNDNDDDDDDDDDHDDDND